MDFIKNQKNPFVQQTSVKEIIFLLGFLVRKKW